MEWAVAQETEELFFFVDGEGVEVGVGTREEATGLQAAGVLPSDLTLVRMGEFAL